MRIGGVVLLLIISVAVLSQGLVYEAGFIFATALCLILFFFFRTREIQIFYVTGIDVIKRARIRRALKETPDVLDLQLPATSLPLKSKAQ
jgi:hypothetical protein